MPAKSFKGRIPDKPITFNLESPDGTKTLTVRCVQTIPGTTLLDFIGKTNAEDPASMAGAVLALIDSAVVEDQREEFHAFIDEAANGVSLEVLSEIAGWVSEQYAGDGSGPLGAAMEPAL